MADHVVLIDITALNKDWRTLWADTDGPTPVLNYRKLISVIEARTCKRVDKVVALTREPRTQRERRFLDGLTGLGWDVTAVGRNQDSWTIEMGTLTAAYLTQWGMDKRPSYNSLTVVGTGRHLREDVPKLCFLSEERGIPKVYHVGFQRAGRMDPAAKRMAFATIDISNWQQELVAPSKPT